MRFVFSGLALIFTVLVVVAAWSQTDPRDIQEASPAFEVPYLLHAPDTVIFLPKKLRETSGLTWLGDHELATVNDEDGDVFVLDDRTGEIIHKTRFADDGDFEGVEVAHGSLFVLRSDGWLFELSEWQGKRVKPNRLRTGLKRSCDAEGLAYDELKNSLLIACKEYPGKNLTGKRAVYRYTLDTRRTDEVPSLVIDALAAELAAPEGKVSGSVRRLLKIPGFKPSAIAIHPVTRFRYVVSPTSTLAIFDTTGALLYSAFLNEEVFPQPEGITFGANAAMFISSEGKSGAGVLARFDYQPKSQPEMRSTPHE